jgi:transcriptional regulator with XRE-family HTH domain
VAREFGPVLRALRQRQGLRQADLAGPGISASYVSMLESGKRAPTPQVVAALAQRLGVDVSELAATLRPIELPDDVRWRLAAAEMALAGGDPAFARTAFAELVAEAGLPAVWGLARADEAGGDLEAAVSGYGRSQDLAREAGDAARSLEASTALARCFAQTRDELRALSVLTEALERVDEAGLTGSDQHVQAMSALLGCHYSLGQLGEATRIATDLLALVDHGGSWKARASAYWNAAGVAEAAGDMSRATAYADRAVALLSEGDDERALARCTVACAWFWLRHPDAVDRLDHIEEMLTGALGRLEQCGSTVDLAYAETELARVALLRARPDVALSWADRAVERLGTDVRSQAPDALLVRAEAQWLSDDADGARASVDRLEMTLLSLPHTREAALTWRSVADLWKRMGEPDAAYRALERALHAQSIHAAPLPAPTSDVPATRVIRRPSR